MQAPSVKKTPPLIQPSGKPLGHAGRPPPRGAETNWNTHSPLLSYYPPGNKRGGRSMSKRISRLDSRRIKRSGRRRAYRLLSQHTHEWRSASFGGQDSSSRQNYQVSDHSLSSPDRNTYAHDTHSTCHKRSKAKHICKHYLEAIEHHLDTDFFEEEWLWTPDCGIAPNTSETKLNSTTSAQS